MSEPSLYWYDFETFGADPRRDRAAQFAGLRTDEELNVTGEPLVIYCRPADDFLPSPVSCLITGITPQLALEKGLIEAEFIARIHGEFSRPGTCVAGFNSIRFDDEVTRQLLYRNFYDPYEREWRSGNSRWDIIDMLRLCAATRPDGIAWPEQPDGTISFRLEELTAANGIEHGQAHDALADVKATIAMARLVRSRQPRLYDYVYQLRDKRRVLAEIDLRTRKPILHVSGMYSASRGCLALVIPLCRHPGNNNGVIVYDLRQEPAFWMEMEAAAIRERLYTPTASLPEGEPRIPLKTLHVNKCPVVASPAALPPEAAARFGVDLKQCRRHWDMLQSRPDVMAKIREVFTGDGLEPETDPDFMIYSGGFFNEHDRTLMRAVRTARPGSLAALDPPFQDPRLAEMLFRYRARNFPDTLSEEERNRWQTWRCDRLQQPEVCSRYRRELDEAEERAAPGQRPVIDAVRQWVAGLQARR